MFKLLFILITLCGLIFGYFHTKYKYWKNAGVPFVKPKFPFGNMKGAMRTIHTGFLMKNFYEQLKGTGAPFGGVYILQSPVAIALNLEFIKRVLVKDFNHFSNRGLYFNEKLDPLSANLFNLKVDKWRKLRLKLTPTFTSNKMKYMFPTIIKVAENFKNHLLKLIEDDSVIDMTEILSRFSTDVIGEIAFGIKCNCIAEPNSKFREMGKKITDDPRLSGRKRLFTAQFPSIANLLHIKLTHDDVEEFFKNVVKDTVDSRELHNIQGNDFMDLLIKLKNTKDESSSLTLNEITAQAVLFHIAGFETTSTAMTFCLYELAINKSIQEKLRVEIHAVLEKYDEKVIYEAMLNIPYLDQVINETLRKYPPAPNLIRQVTIDYYVPELKHVLKKDTLIFLPVYAIHHDPEFYPEPDRFDPNRFCPETINERKQCTFFPFGDGQRNCIGMRFALMEIRITLIILLNTFEFSVSPDLKIPFELSNSNRILAFKDPLYLKVNKLSR